MHAPSEAPATIPRSGARRVAWRWCGAALLILGLAACGGGGGGGEAGSAALAPSAAKQMSTAKKANPTLVAQPVSLVNTTTAGDQSLRAIGALSDGGYTVAWISGTTLSMQRYDSAGNKTGTETPIQLVVNPRDTASQVLAASSVAVLTDGTVVVAYAVRRTSLDPNTPNVSEDAVYMQRFDADGVQILPETLIASLVDTDPRRPTTFGSVQVVPMPDGGYVVGWGTFRTSATVGSVNTFSTERFNNQNQPVGGIVNIAPAGVSLAQYRIVADTDADGGYTLYWSGTGPDFQPTGLNVTHYDANQVATPILTGWMGNALLLALEDGRYVLYTSDAMGGVYSQFLDSAGAPVGEKTATPFMPVAAQLLADGSYVVFWTATSGGMTAQRYDANGQAMGDLLTLQTSGTQRQVVGLADGGFAVAWTAQGADLDVYTQRFIEAAGSQRKACLDAAKGMKGQARKAFMTACLQ